MDYPYLTLLPINVRAGTWLLIDAPWDWSGLTFISVGRRMFILIKPPGLLPTGWADESDDEPSGPSISKGVE